MIAMQGAARMVLDGQHPAMIRNAVATPGGCTIGGLLTMEDGKIRSTLVWIMVILYWCSGADDPGSDKCCKWTGEISALNADFRVKMGIDVWKGRFVRLDCMYQRSYMSPKSLNGLCDVLNSILSLDRWKVSLSTILLVSLLHLGLGLKSWNIIVVN